MNRLLKYEELNSHRTIQNENPVIFDCVAVDCDNCKLKSEWLQKSSFNLSRMFLSLVHFATSTLQPMRV